MPLTFPSDALHEEDREENDDDDGYNGDDDDGRSDHAIVNIPVTGTHSRIDGGAT